jgi:hypothetical protein
VQGERGVSLVGGGQGIFGVNSHSSQTVLMERKFELLLGVGFVRHGRHSFGDMEVFSLG